MNWMAFCFILSNYFINVNLTQHCANFYLLIRNSLSSDCKIITVNFFWLIESFIFIHVWFLYQFLFLHSIHVKRIIIVAGALFHHLLFLLQSHIHSFNVIIVLVHVCCIFHISCIDYNSFFLYCWCHFSYESQIG